jgi:UDP-GlcNAc:undecaprenyl-phosphate GlcNAc-1-phosphate transferase
MSRGITAFAIALLFSIVLTVPVRALALRVGMVDRPGPRKLHLTPIPLLGGLAIYLGVVIALFATLNGPALEQSLGILAGATLVVIVGILDDRGLLHHQIKLFVGMPAAGLILLATGIRSHFFETWKPGTVSQAADVALTLLWVVGVTASFSIFDHMDGLCAGVAAVASVFYFLFAYQSGQVLVSTLSAAVLGATLGFLRWNFNPAKIFMGDGGAMFLGFLMAAIGLKLRLGELHHATSWMIPILILGVPIFDTTLVTISRSRRGLLPFASPGKDHAAHRLSNLGLGHRGAALVLYALGFVFGGLALLVPRLSIRQGLAVGAAAAVAALVAIALLERAPYERQAKRSKM